MGTMTMDKKLDETGIKGTKRKEDIVEQKSTLISTKICSEREQGTVDSVKQPNEMHQSGITFYGGDNLGKGTGTTVIVVNTNSSEDSDSIKLNDNSQLSLHQYLFREIDSPERLIMRPVFDSAEDRRNMERKRKKKGSSKRENGIAIDVK